MARLPSVSVICGNASTNGLGRALLLADLLRTETNVQIVGIGSKDTIWAPGRGSPVPIRSFTVPEHPWNYWRAIPWLREAVGEDCVVVSKTLLQSLGLAVVSAVGKGGLIIDIDDWETGLRQRGAFEEGMTGPRQRAARAASYIQRAGANQFVMARLLEIYARRHRHRLVSNRWLQARFGGEILYHVRDPAELDPGLPSSFAIEPLPPGPVWVGFIGTVKPHKGIGVLVDAVAAVRRRADVGLVLMGVDAPDAPIIAEARRLLGPGRFRTLPPFPFRSLRDHVRLPDVLAIPSLDTPAAWGQIPAKLFDAMSMAKPVVASALNDMPEILEGAGLVVPPGDRSALASALVTLAKDPDARDRLGRRGREKLIEKYSYAAGRRVLLRVLREAAG
jgi:glycosyltransferase involved in cell wall biosynthesis